MIHNKTTSTISRSIGGEDYEIDVTVFEEELGGELYPCFEIDAIWLGDETLDSAEDYTRIYKELDSEEVFNEAWGESLNISKNLSESMKNNVWSYIDGDRPCKIAGKNLLDVVSKLANLKPHLSQKTIT